MNRFNTSISVDLLNIATEMISTENPEHMIRTSSARFTEQSRVRRDDVTCGAWERAQLFETSVGSSERERTRQKLWMKARARSDNALGAAAASEGREGGCSSLYRCTLEPVLTVVWVCDHCVTVVSVCLTAPRLCSMFPFTSAWRTFCCASVTMSHCSAGFRNSLSVYI